MKKLEMVLNQLESKIFQFERINQGVSETNVGWHIEHSLLVINSIIDALSVSNPADYKWAFNLPRLLVFTLKKIPRGKAKAPKMVIPTGEYDAQSLTKLWLQTKHKVEGLYEMDKGKYFEHPYFGKIKVPQAITFLNLHSTHHLYIINDILR